MFILFSEDIVKQGVISSLLWEFLQRLVSLFWCSSWWEVTFSTLSKVLAVVLMLLVAVCERSIRTHAV